MSYNKRMSLELSSLLVEASYEKTSPARLKDIYLNSDISDIYLNLTSNPNTPLDILLQLGKYYPVQLLENPVLDLYLLSNPNLLTEMPENTLISILKLSQAPKEFILYTLNNRRTPQLLGVIISNQTPLWQKWRENNSDFRIDLSNADLHSANFKGVDLDSACLQDANLRGADLRGANLRGANLRGANLSGADLEGTNLRGAKLEGANLRGVKLNKGTIIDKKWRLVWNIVNNPTEGKNLQFADLYGADLEYACLQRADLEGANLRGANLKGANLKGANLRGVKLNEQTIINEKWRLVWDIVNNPAEGRNLKSVDLKGANLQSANLRSADLEGANFSGANLKGANFSGANLRGVKLNEQTIINEKWRLVWDIVNNPTEGRNLKSADLKGANLRCVNLKSANLSRANLSGANLWYAKLNKADLSNADLSNADLSYANLTNADLTQIKMDKNTKISRYW